MRLRVFTEAFTLGLRLGMRGGCLPRNASPCFQPPDEVRAQFGAGASIVTAPVMTGCPLVSVIVCEVLNVPAVSKSIVSAPGFEFASLIARRGEPAP